MLTRDSLAKILLIGTVLVTNSLACALGWYWLYQSRTQYETRAESLTQNLAFGLDRSVTNIIDKLDLILETTAQELERRSALGRLEMGGFARFIDSHAARLPELAAIGVADARGQVILATGSIPLSQSDLRSELYFTQLRDHPDSGLYVSPPLDNVVEHKKVLVFARAALHGNGGLAGIVLAALPIDPFVQLMAQYAAARQGSMSLRALDNSVIARYPLLPPGAALAGDSSDALRRAIQSGEQVATLNDRSTADGVARIVTLRRLDIAPLYVVSALPQDEYLAAWRGEVKKTIWFLLALFLVTSVASGFIYRLFIIAARQSRRNRMFLERASDGVHVLDGNGILIEASDSFCAMLGYTREELIGRHRSLWETREQIAGGGATLPGLIGDERPISFETQHRRRDGSLIAVELSTAAVVTRHEVYEYASSRDITERNRLKEEIDSALARFEAIFQNNPVPLGMIDFNSGIYLDVNPAWEKLSGLTRKEVVGRGSSEIGLWADPGERHRFFASIGKDGSIGPLEGQIHRRDGNVVICSVKGRVIALGTKRLFIWAVEDVTERKRTEVGLRLAASVFDFSHDGIMVTDIENRIIEVNPAFTRITGHAREDVLGQDPAILGSGRDGKEYFAPIWESLAESGGWRGEIWNQRKNGEVYPALMSIAAIRDDDGQIQRYIGVFSDISQIKAHEAELHRVAHFDALTGLPNRRLLADRMHQAIARARRNETSLAICFVDLDGFKEVNDQLGHEVGDRLLIAVSSYIQEVLRADDTLARLGGDEFVILLNDAGNDKKCFQVLDRVLAAIIEAANSIDPGIAVSGSIGVTLFPRDDADPDTLLRHADQAMYRAKESGKGRYHRFDPEHDRQVRASHEALQRIAIAIERDEFVLHFQPKVNMVTGAVVGTEALIRWLHPERGVVSPGSFLPLLEGVELGITLGNYVLEAALTQLERWKAAGLLLPLSVNVSPNHLQAPHFIKKLQAILDRHPLIKPGDLQLEITESTAISDIKRTTATLEACHRMGLSLALDDFGTGYSSLTYFRKLPIDLLKIDQSFVRDMLNHPDDLGLVAGVIQLAQAFNRPVIAEGVETEQHGDLLVKLGCPLGQGFGIARPMPAELLIDWVKYWQGGAGWRFTPA